RASPRPTRCHQPPYCSGEPKSYRHAAPGRPGQPRLLSGGWHSGCTPRSCAYTRITRYALSDGNVNQGGQRMYEQVHEGMDVLDRNGEKIGKAGETLGQFFNVDAGFLGMKEYYVPFDAVTEVRENAVYLNVDKGEIDGLGWDSRPEERQSAATTTTTGRSEADTMRLREEQLHASTTPVETGRVQVGKDVVEEQRSVDVPV